MPIKNVVYVINLSIFSILVIHDHGIINAACTFPSIIQGTWYNPNIRSLTYNSTNGVLHESTRTLNFACDTNFGSNIIVYRARAVGPCLDGLLCVNHTFITRTEAIFVILSQPSGYGLAACGNAVIIYNTIAQSVPAGTPANQSLHCNFKGVENYLTKNINNEVRSGTTAGPLTTNALGSSTLLVAIVVPVCLIALIVAVMITVIVVVRARNKSLRKEGKKPVLSKRGFRWYPPGTNTDNGRNELTLTEEIGSNNSDVAENSHTALHSLSQPVYPESTTTIADYQHTRPDGDPYDELAEETSHTYIDILDHVISAGDDYEKLDAEDIAAHTSTQPRAYEEIMDSSQ